MSNFNTIVRTICTLVVVSALSGIATAQSVLNFTPTGAAEISVINPTTKTADVQFTLYNPDGSIVGGNNPVLHRIQPRGQLRSSSSEIFPSLQGTGWIQATSSVAGLQGVYFSGDFTNTVDGADSLVPFDMQVIPYIRSGQTNIVLTNPGNQAAEVTVVFYNNVGGQVGGPVEQILGAHAQAIIPGAGTSARISSTPKILAIARIGTAESLMLVKGQAIDLSTTASTRVVPHFEVSSQLSSSVVVMNPTGSPVLVTARFNTASTIAGLSSWSFPLVPNGSYSFSWLNQLFAPPAQGWVQIESAVPLNLVSVFESRSASSAIPVQTAPLDRMIFLWDEAGNLHSQLAAVHTADEEATLTFSLVRRDGTTVARRSDSIPARQKMTRQLSELFPEGAGLTGGYVVVESSAPLYAIEITEDPGVQQFRTAISPQSASPAFLPAPIGSRPRLSSVEPPREVAPGVFEVTVNTESAGSSPQLVLGGKPPVPLTTTVPGLTSFTARLNLAQMDLEPGFITVRIRVAGVDSNAVMVRITPERASLTEVLTGYALYQKVIVNDNGLDTNNTVMVPIRNARVEVVERLTSNVLSVSETDDQGQFKVAVPNRPDLTIRVQSRLFSQDLKVLDNTDANKLYAISVDVDMRVRPARIEFIDTARLSGAFNILEVIQRGNDLIASVEPRPVPPVTIYWSQRNVNRSGNPRDGLVGTTFFNLTAKTAYVLGDRLTDSDEFDDSVIAHEYAHMLAAHFSRDDSPGGAHSLGDLLDPRVAWSEGFANFFSAAALGSPIFRDSKGPTGALSLRYDLEENRPNGDNPGYRSEASVQSLLWDMIDENADAEDVAQFPFSAVWLAVTDLQNDRYVYLPFFLERFITRYPAFRDSLTVMAQLRSINFYPDVRPSVANPFPSVITANGTVRGDVDSFTTRRTNLALSSHFYAFTWAGGAALISLQIEGPGLANNLNANDLDIFLLDANGAVVDRSDRGLNGDSEIINQVIPAGFYVVEVRSFYRRAETNTMVFNSGRYKLDLKIQ